MGVFPIRLDAGCQVRYYITRIDNSNAKAISRHYIHTAEPVNNQRMFSGALVGVVFGDGLDSTFFQSRLGVRTIRVTQNEHHLVRTLGDKVITGSERP